MSPLDTIKSQIPEANTTSDISVSTREMLKTRILTLNECTWENKIRWNTVENWLSNFDGSSGAPADVEQLHALYLLSRFLYFGSLEIRVLLRSLFRDLVYLPILQEVKAGSDKNIGPEDLRQLVHIELSQTRFLGVGTPSESGVHLLYFFRQENGLSKHHFLDQAQLLVPDPNNIGSYKLRYPDLKRLIFVDDVCGSGETAVRYSRGPILPEVMKLNPSIEMAYYSLFATSDGLARVIGESCFSSNTKAVFELDRTYRCLSDHSRYLTVMPEPVKPDTLRRMAEFYGEKLLNSEHALGYENSQLLFGFHHNTPDNTLPIIWAESENGARINWNPIFRRYPKGAMS